MTAAAHCNGVDGEQASEQAAEHASGQASRGSAISSARSLARPNSRTAPTLARPSSRTAQLSHGPTLARPNRTRARTSACADNGTPCSGCGGGAGAGARWVAAKAQQARAGGGVARVHQGPRRIAVGAERRARDPCGRRRVGRASKGPRREARPRPPPGKERRLHAVARGRRTETCVLDCAPGAVDVARRVRDTLRHVRPADARAQGDRGRIPGDGLRESCVGQRRRRAVDGCAPQ